MSTTQTSGPPRNEYRHFISDTRRWDGFEHRPGDILVCTPPKCGTTWTQTIVAMLLFPDGNLPAPVTTLSPWIEARFKPYDEMLEGLRQQTHRRSIKSHTSADGVPWWPDARYIVVGRDGRDAFMSFVNHIASMRPEKIGELIESALAEGIAFEPLPPSDDIHAFFAGWLADGRLFSFLDSYWQLRHEPNVLFVHYDDLKANLESEVRRIAAFLDIPVEHRHLPGILERCSFDWMKKNSERIGDFGDLFTGGGESFFFKGTNGRWQGVLTPQELEQYDKRSRQMMPPDLKEWLDRG